MSALDTAARLIVSQVRQLERRIRADEQPRFAELHDLFESTRELERHLAESGAVVRIECAARPCPCDGVNEVIAGQRHCDFHAQQLRSLMGKVA